MTKKPARLNLSLSIGTKIMLVFFVIFTLLVCTCSYHGFTTEKERIITSYSENIRQTETAITTAVSLVSRGTMVLSSIYDTPMADALDRMETAYMAAGGDPAKIDLTLLRNSIQDDFTDDVHLYIIDETNVVIDTTDSEQMGADFSLYPAFAERLSVIRKGTSYVGDPWEQSVSNPDRIRKYGYLPTADHHYILGIGLYNKQLDDPNTLFFSYGDVTDNLETADNAIESVLIVDTNGVIMEKSRDETKRWYANHPYLSSDDITDTAARVLRTGNGIEKAFPNQERLVHIFYIYPGFSKSDPSDTVYAAIVVYSTEELNDSLADAFSQYLLIFLGGLVFAAGVGYIVAYTLGRPIEMIARDVNEIAKGNLTHEIRPTHSNELRRLEESIRILVKRLGEDITEIQAQSVALDIELKEKTLVEKRLRDANRKLSLLSTITRHDILNQLGVLGMYCDLLEELADHCPGLSDYITRIEDTLKKIERQLTFARDYESMGLEEPRFQILSDVVGNALSSVHAPFIRFSVETDGAEICADPMLEKVFYNLFENAIRHGGKELSEISITFVGTPGDSGHITVTDNGNGVAAAKKHKIFQRGYGSNTGYGLFLVAEILSITGITIYECGIEGKGARFEIDVPQASWRMHRNPD